MAFSFRGSDAERRILQELAERARAGMKEAGYLVDEDTGEILDYREADDATPYEVDFPEAAAQSRPRVCYLHSHYVPSPPSESDWANVVELPQIVRYVTVCSDRFYTLERTPGTHNPYRVSPRVIFAYEFAIRLKQSSLSHLSLRAAFRQLLGPELQQILSDVNLKMTGIYEVQFSEERLL